VASRWLIACGVMAASLAILPGPTGAQKPTDAARSTEHYRKDYRFTADWFTPAIPVWKKVLKDYQGKPDIHYLEVEYSRVGPRCGPSRTSSRIRRPG
jgi:hypothetical protein